MWGGVKRDGIASTLPSFTSSDSLTSLTEYLPSIGEGWCGMVWCSAVSGEMAQNCGCGCVWDCGQRDGETDTPNTKDNPSTTTPPTHISTPLPAPIPSPPRGGLPPFLMVMDVDSGQSNQSVNPSPTPTPQPTHRPLDDAAAAAGGAADAVVASGPTPEQAIEEEQEGEEEEVVVRRRQCWAPITSRPKNAELAAWAGRRGYSTNMASR
jgi:hypothetical protein